MLLGAPSRYESQQRNNVIGDFQFVVMEKFLSQDNDLPIVEKIIMKLHFWLKEISLSEERGFALQSSNVTIEKFPLVVSSPPKVKVRRIIPTRKAEPKWFDRRSQTGTLVFG